MQYTQNYKRRSNSKYSRRLSINHIKLMQNLQIAKTGNAFIISNSIDVNSQCIAEILSSISNVYYYFVFLPKTKYKISPFQLVSEKWLSNILNSSSTFNKCSWRALLTNNSQISPPFVIISNIPLLSFSIQHKNKPIGFTLKSYQKQPTMLWMGVNKSQSQ